MKSLVALLTLAMLTSASAQSMLLPPSNFEIPKTITLYNKATKETFGTVTISGHRLYYRNPDGKHVATVEINKDGTRTAYDENGKIIENPALPALPQ